MGLGIGETLITVNIRIPEEKMEAQATNSL